MAYNLYQTQMAKAWAQRIDKENAQAEKFWTDQALRVGAQAAAQSSGGNTSHVPHYAASIAPSHATSAAPTGFTSKSTFLKDRLEKLEQELQQEKDYRYKVEEELATLKGSPRAGSKPGTPRH